MSWHKGLFTETSLDAFGWPSIVKIRPWVWIALFVIGAFLFGAWLF